MEQKTKEVRTIADGRASDNKAVGAGATDNRATADEAAAAGLFTDDVVNRTILEDPLAKFVNKNWRQIVGVIAVIGVAYFGYFQFTAAYESRIKGAADLYRKVREQYATLVETRDGVLKESDPKKKEEMTKGLRESSRKLSESIRSLGDASYPYSEISRIYRALLSSLVAPDGTLTTDSKLAREALQPLDWSVQKVGTPERFLAELRALLLARTLLDVKESEAEGRTILKALASGGSVVHASAALTLSQIASSDDERREAKATLEALRANHVEQGEVIDAELQRYQ